MLSASMVPIVMSSNKGETKIGVVVENLPNTMFRVQFDDTEELQLTYLAGKMKLYRIRILVGDKVEVLLDPYGGKGRIIKRL
jgi:translation initiation factor IF-1